MLRRLLARRLALAASRICASRCAASLMSRGAAKRVTGSTCRCRQPRIHVERGVTAGKTILEALEAAGLAPVHSCRTGVCGACETRILDGTALHRDSILTEAERKAGKSMMICCSSSRGALLVIDL